MKPGASDGLTVDAEVRRGSFTLTVSLAAASGKVLGLLGPNGAGKSTLLSAVAGLTPLRQMRYRMARLGVSVGGDSFDGERGGS